MSDDKKDQGSGLRDLLRKSPISSLFGRSGRQETEDSGQSPAARSQEDELDFQKGIAWGLNKKIWEAIIDEPAVSRRVKQRLDDARKTQAAQLRRTFDNAAYNAFHRDGGILWHLGAFCDYALDSLDNERDDGVARVALRSPLETAVFQFHSLKKKREAMHAEIGPLGEEPEDGHVEEFLRGIHYVRPKVFLEELEEIQQDLKSLSEEAAYLLFPNVRSVGREDCREQARQLRIMSQKLLNLSGRWEKNQSLLEEKTRVAPFDTTVSADGAQLMEAAEKFFDRPIVASLTDSSATGAFDRDAAMALAREIDKTFPDQTEPN